MGRNGKNITSGGGVLRTTGRDDRRDDARSSLSNSADDPQTCYSFAPVREDLLTELGNEELFRRILAVGYMSYQAFEKNRKKRLGETYKPNTIREVAARFNISTSRLMDFCRGAAINREDTQRVKMLKAEKKEETEGKTPTRSRAASPEEQATPQPSTSKE